MKLKRMMVKYSRPTHLTKNDGIEYWREKIILIILLVLVIFGVPAVVPGVTLAIINKVWVIAIMDIAVYLIVLYIFINKKIKYKTKAAILTTVSYLLGLILLIVIGPKSAGYIWIFVVPVFAAIFFTSRIAYSSVFLNLATLFLFGLVHYFDLMDSWINSDLTIGAWIVISTSFMLLNFGVVFPILQIITGLENTLNKEKGSNKILRFQAEELIKSKEEAVRANKVKSEFLAQISHEIRTPVNTILNYSSLIKMDLAPEQKKEMEDSFDAIERGSIRLIRTIDMILNMSELERGSYNIIREKIYLNQEVLQPLYKEFLPEAHKKNIRLEILNCKTEKQIIVDRYTITQLFTNLIDNAIKYTEQGSVQILLTQNNGKSMVTIRDTGVGISEDYMPKLFEIFSQEEQGYNRKFDGNGLGLALVKKYCQLNKVQIKVSSKKGSGTIFTLNFTQ